MKKWRMYLEEALVHICVVLSIACISFQILDWYNPYMDFGGHTAVLHYLLYFGALGLGISRIFRQGGRQKHAGQQRQQPQQEEL